MKKLLIASALLLGLLLPTQVKAQNIFLPQSEYERQIERQEDQQRQDEQRRKQQDLERRIDELEEEERQIESDPAQRWLRHRR